MNTVFCCLMIYFSALTPSAVLVDGEALPSSADVMVEEVSEEVRSAQMGQVTTVYGVTASTYDSERSEAIQAALWTGDGEVSGSVSFDLPDAFYFIAAPIFLILFIRIFATLLDDIEEQRIQELREDYYENHGMY